MTTHFTNLVVRHERRVRVIFDGALAGAAFTSSSYYAISSQDGAGPNPGVSPIIVANVTNVVELALDADLIDGGLYLLTVTNVPAVDASTPSGSQLFRFSSAPGTVDTEVSPDDVDALLYGDDCVWTGADYLETPAGDLAGQSGPEVVQADLVAGFLSDGLPWDPTFGGHPRKYIDGSALTMPTLQGSLKRFALSDDRVKTADVAFIPDPDNAAATFDIDCKLIGDGDSVSVPVRVSTS